MNKMNESGLDDREELLPMWAPSSPSRAYYSPITYFCGVFFLSLDWTNILFYDNNRINIL